MTRAPDAREGTTDAPTTNPLAVYVHREMPEALDAVPLPVFTDAHRRARNDGASREESKPLGVSPRRLPAAETEARR